MLHAVIFIFMSWEELSPDRTHVEREHLFSGYHENTSKYKKKQKLNPSDVLNAVCLYFLLYL